MCLYDRLQYLVLQIRGIQLCQWRKPSDQRIRSDAQSVSDLTLRILCDLTGRQLSVDRLEKAGQQKGSLPHPDIWRSGKCLLYRAEGFTPAQ